MRSDIDNGEVMQCLLAHRKDAEIAPVCRQYIDHYELISMRDYNFTPLFAKMCQSDVDKHCKDTPHEK
jgi:Golgi apparatus protein 1